MKKTITTILLLTVLAFVSGCGSAAEDVSKALYEQGLEITQRMDELASSKAYAEAMSASAELMEAVSAMGSGDYSSPAAAYRITLSKDAIPLLLGQADLSLSEELDEWVKGRAYFALPNMLVSRSGAAQLAAANVISYSYSFSCEGLDSPTLILYQYDGAYSAAVSFRPSQDGTVSASALFIPNDGLFTEAHAPAELSALLGELTGISGINVADITLPA